MAKDLNTSDNLELGGLIALARRAGALFDVVRKGDSIETVAILRGIKPNQGKHQLPNWVALQQLRRAKAAGELGPVIRSVSIGPLPRPMPQGMVDPLPVIVARLSDESAVKLFSFYPDEIQFSEAEFLGKTVEEAMEIKRAKDVAYLSGNPAAQQVQCARRVAEIALDLQNQDNLATAEPLFLVKQLERVWGVEPGYTDKFAWLDADNVETGAELDAMLDSNELKQAAELGYKRVGYIEIEAYVTACFTRSAAERYIDENKHNLNHPFVFVDSLNKNPEMIFVRQQLLAGRPIGAAHVGDEMKEKTFEVSGAVMLRLLKEGNGQLHRWDMGFFCMSPQPVEYVYGDAPKEPWVGSVMFQQMVGNGDISSEGVLQPEQEHVAHKTPRP